MKRIYQRSSSAKLFLATAVTLEVLPLVPGGVSTHTARLNPTMMARLLRGFYLLEHQLLILPWYSTPALL